MASKGDLQILVGIQKFRGYLGLRQPFAEQESNLKLTEELAASHQDQRSC